MIFLKKYKPRLLSDYKTNNDFKNIIQNLIETENLNILINGNSDSGKTCLLDVILNTYYQKSTINEKEKTDAMEKSKINEITNEKIYQNVLQINSLGDNGIHFYRNEVKTFCKIPCSIGGKKKIILIDDIDLLNSSGQQIFRNFIDNYNKNVFFITSCTNIHKVIETIQSRLHILKLPYLSENHILELCEEICKYENLNIQNDARKYLIKLSNYSLRSLVCYLEKLSLLEEKFITCNVIDKICNTINFTFLEEYTVFLFKNRNLESAIDIIHNFHTMGYSTLDILTSYLLFIKSTNIINEEIKYKILPSLCNTIKEFYCKHEDVSKLYIFTFNLYKLI